MISWLQKLFSKESGDDGALAVRRKQTLLTMAVVGALGLGFVWVQSGVHQAVTPPPVKERPKKVLLNDLVDEKAVWVSRVEEQAQKIEKIAQSTQTDTAFLKERIEQLEKALAAKAAEGGGISGRGEPPSLEESRESPRGALPLETPDFSEGKLSLEEKEAGLAPGQKILHFSRASDEEASSAADTIVAGTYAKAVLTSGVVVSTAVATQSNPQPIVVRLLDAGNLPRGWKSTLKDAVLIGSCYGDLSSERAVCRLQTLSLVERSGKTFEKPVEGWILGEDGAPGIRGKVVDRSGPVAREAFLAGILGGMSNFLKFEAERSVFPVTPFGQTQALGPQEALKGSVGKGAGNALDKLADFSIKRAEAMQPVIVVTPGRVVDIVFKKGFSLKESSTVPLKPVKLPTSSERTLE